VETTTPEGTRYYDYSCGAKLSQVSIGSETLSYGYDGDLMISISAVGPNQSPITRPGLFREGVQHSVSPKFQNAM